MDNFKALGLDESVYNEAEEQTVSEGFKPLDSGIYKAKVKELAIFETDSGAGMLKIVVSPIDLKDSLTDITVYQNIKKKNGEANPIGTATLKHILDACNTTLEEVVVKNEEIVGYGKPKQAKVIKGIQDKVILAFIRSVHEEGAKYETYNEIEAYARQDGTNAKGEDLTEAFKKKIEKNPVLKRKAKEPVSNGTTAKTADGKNIADLL